jgi:iron complex outermembrane receptor protein
MRGSNPTTKLSRRFLGGALSAVFVGALSFGGTSALAQGIEIEEIIVTAQRREQAIEDVPMSVSTLSGERMTSMFEAGETVLAMANRIPALYAESSNGRLAPRFYMRGLGNTDFDLAASQSVSILFDEVVQENVILKSFPLFDMDRVEVLRGPQGTLFGRNTPAGIVKFDTRRPTSSREGYAQASVGSYGTINVEGAISGALNDNETLMGRFSLLSQNREDWIDNSFTGQDDALGGYNELAWRAQLLAEPADNLSILLNLHGRDFDGTASIFRANVFNAGSNELNNNYDRDLVQFDEGNNNPQDAEAYGGLLRIELEFENGVEFTSITGMETVQNSSEGDIDGGNVVNGPGFIPFPSHTKDGIDELQQFTQELRLSGENADGMFWQAGYYYFSSDFTVTTNPFFVAPSSVQHTNDAWAMFGQISLPLNDRLTLTGGVRYTDDDKEAFIFNEPGAPVPDVRVSGEQSSFDVSLMFDVNDDFNVYGRIANGFRAPSIQARDVAFFGPTSVADAETILSYEVGFKSSMADGQLVFNGAIFHYTVDDMQLSAIGGQSNMVQLINAEEGTGTGLDLDMALYLSENFVITAGYSTVDTEIRDPMLTLPGCGSGQCTPQDPTDPVSGNLRVNGNPFPGAPESTLNFTARFAIPTDSGEFFVFTDWYRQGKTNFFLYESAEFFSDGNYEGGLRIGYINHDNNWELTAFGRNITDEENVKGGIDFNNLTGFDNEPRVFGLTFRKGWGQ